MAQDESASDNEAAGDIIVTARRVEERLQDVPISITVLNQGGGTEPQHHHRDRARDLHAVALDQSAVRTRQGLVRGIRGFSQIDTTSPTVGVYFADVVALRANAGTTSGNGAGPGQFFDLQNVQVLKGPQGTLFGRNTTGGAILLVPQRPKDKFEGYVEGSVGNYDLWRVQAVINAAAVRHGARAHRHRSAEARWLHAQPVRRSVPRISPIPTISRCAPAWSQTLRPTSRTILSGATAGRTPTA